MDTTLFFLKTRVVLWTMLVSSLCAGGVLWAQTNPPAPPAQKVSQRPSTMIRNATVYSIEFPGGTAREFFKFLQTNGFASDTVLFSKGAAEVPLPDFTLRNVRLPDVAQALALLSEDRLKVELKEAGPASDVNVWGIRVAESIHDVRSRACAMPNLFRRQDAPERVAGIADSVQRAVAEGMETAGNRRGLPLRGTVHTLRSEKIVVVVGIEAYVEAVAGALEAAEKAASAESPK